MKRRELAKIKVRVFTDGACSKNPGPGGWAVAFNYETGCATFSGGEEETTNNRMELLAVVRAMKEIVSSKGFEFEILSDSAYVVNAIKNCWLEKWMMNNWLTAKGDEVKNKDLWRMFIKLRKEARENKIKVEFTKVKGHSGNSFNDYVDRIARSEALAMKGCAK